MSERTHATAHYLAGLRQPGPRPLSLPADLSPRDEAEAYAVQAEVAQLLNARPGAWKVAMSSMDQGTSAPVFGSDLRPSGAAFTSPITRELGIEPEIAFTLGRDLAPGRRYTRQQVIDAIGSAHAAIEIVISRFQRHESAPVLDRLADNLSNGGLILGTPVERWQGLDFSTILLTLSLTPSGSPARVHRGQGGHPQADPLVPMLWIVNDRAARGSGMRQGEVVTTGSYAGLHYAPPGTRVRAEFEGLGAVELCS